MDPGERVAVLAGTPADSRMGVRLLAAHGMAGMSFPLAEDPRRQTALQLMPPEVRQRAVQAALDDAIQQGLRRVLVYCNSLASVVDFPTLARETGVQIVTPLEIYQTLAPHYRRLGVLAANAQGLAGIERTLYAANSELELLGSCILPGVEAVEAGETPEELVERLRLPELARWFHQCGMEALLLGCTHFPYFKTELAERTSLPLLDPSEEMVHRLAAPAKTY